MHPMMNIMIDYPETAYGDFSRFNRLEAIDKKIEALREKRKQAVMKVRRIVNSTEQWLAND